MRWIDIDISHGTRTHTHTQTQTHYLLCAKACQHLRGQHVCLARVVSLDPAERSYGGRGGEGGRERKINQDVHNIYKCSKN